MTLDIKSQRIMLLASVFIFSLAAAIMVMSGLWGVAALLAVPLLFLVLLRNDWALNLIIIALFFDAYVFSFYFAGMRIRIVQLLEVLALAGLLVSVFIGRIKLKKTPMDLVLWLYVLINFVALINAPLMKRSLKISLLILSLALLYYVIVNFITDRKHFDRVFHLLLYVGIAQILYGIYQVFAAICNTYLNTKLPIGFAGTIDVKFIGTYWGRPYGTMVEPDWYGALAMFYSLLFIILFFSKCENKEKRFYLFGMTVCLTGLLLSFVRASWIGFLAGLFFISLFSHRIASSRIRVYTFIKVLIALAVVILSLRHVSTTFDSTIKNRLGREGETSISLTNVRFVQMSRALDLFMEHPILGNGAGSFSVQGIWGHSEDYYNRLAASGKMSLERRYDPSILTTVLEDTGIVGSILFILFLGRFFVYNLKTIPSIAGRYQTIGLGLFAGMVGLFASYTLTTGFWMPFTWVFLGFNIYVLRLGLSGNEGKAV